MTTNSISLEPELPHHHEAVETLAEIAFGPGRFTRTAFRLREGIPHEPALSFVAYDDEKLVGSVRLTKIMVGEQASLLLGPLVVSPEYKNTGFGKLLMEKAVSAGREQGHGSILLVGDLPYYQRFGFEVVPKGTMTLPGPVDPARLLVCYLQDKTTPLSGLARVQA